MQGDEVHYIPLKLVCAGVGVSRATLYRMVAQGAFPRSRQLGPNRVAWRSDEVTAWMRPDARYPWCYP